MKKLVGIFCFSNICKLLFIVIIDDWFQIGSSNIADDYSGIKYGSYYFVDLNMFLKNICIEQARLFFKKIADNYNIRLNSKFSNQEIIEQYTQMYPNSKFFQGNIQLLRTHPPKIHEINEFVLSQINKAKNNITVIQPYYMPIKIFENAISNALERGVNVELITSVKRDIPVYAKFKNIWLTKQLIRKGMKLYEMHDKYLHMKAYAFDNKIFSVGSFNNDVFSWFVNNEVNVAIEGKQSAQKFSKIIDEVKSHTKEVTKQNEEVSFSRQMKIYFWDIFLNFSEWVMRKKESYNQKFIQSQLQSQENS